MFCAIECLYSLVFGKRMNVDTRGGKGKSFDIRGFFADFARVFC